MEKGNKHIPEQDKVVYEVIQKLGVVAEYSTGWTKEVNLISWNNKEPKLDIRDWDEKHEHMSRGITLKCDEAEKVAELLSAFAAGGEQMARA